MSQEKKNSLCSWELTDDKVDTVAFTTHFVKIGTTENELYFVSLKLLRFARANIGP